MCACVSSLNPKAKAMTRVRGATVSMPDVFALILGVVVVAQGAVLSYLFMNRERSRNELHYERTRQYLDVFPRIAGLFLEPDIQHLPPAASTLKIHEIIAQTALISGPRLEELLMKYMETVDQFHDALAKPESEDVAHLHAELSGLVADIRQEMRHEIGLDDKTTGN